jgi:hypothetical protein
MIFLFPHFCQRRERDGRAPFARRPSASRRPPARFRDHAPIPQNVCQAGPQAPPGRQRRLPPRLPSGAAQRRSRRARASHHGITASSGESGKKRAAPPRRQMPSCRRISRNVPSALRNPCKSPGFPEKGRDGLSVPDIGRRDRASRSAGYEWTPELAVTRFPMLLPRSAQSPRLEKRLLKLSSSVFADWPEILSSSTFSPASSSVTFCAAALSCCNLSILAVVAFSCAFSASIFF